MEYLENRADAQGVHTLQLAKKLKAILGAETAECAGILPIPGQPLWQVSSNLGNHPLNMLLWNGQPWRWSQECTQAFQKARRKLTETLAPHTFFK